MSEGIKLLPCPFCGGDGDIIRNADHWLVVQCDNCGSQGPCIEVESAKSIATWNTRTTPQALAATPAVGGEALLELKKENARLRALLRAVGYPAADEPASSLRGRETFDAWFNSHFLDPDGRSKHLPDWLKDDLRSAWDAASASPPEQPAAALSSHDGGNL